MNVSLRILIFQNLRLLSIHNNRSSRTQSGDIQTRISIKTFNIRIMKENITPTGRLNISTCVLET